MSNCAAVESIRLINAAARQPAGSGSSPSIVIAPHTLASFSGVLSFNGNVIGKFFDQLFHVYALAKLKEEIDPARFATAHGFVVAETNVAADQFGIAGAGQLAFQDIPQAVMRIFSCCFIARTHLDIQQQTSSSNAKSMKAVRRTSRLFGVLTDFSAVIFYF